MEDTMRDILSKLDQLLSETSLEDLKNLPGADDPIIAKAIADKEKEQKQEDQHDEDLYQIGDEFGISFTEDFEIGATITDILEDGVVIALDDIAMEMLANEGISFLDVQLDEEKQKGLDGKACWKGYKRMGTKMKSGKRVDNCVKMEDSDLEEKSFPFAGKAVGHKEGPAGWLTGKDRRPAKAGDLVGSESIDYNDEDIEEAKYQGREVPLGKPMKGDVKKSKVYVKSPKGNVVKVNFGDKKMRIKKSNPSRRKSFRARHKCHTAKDRTTARYWSCRSW
jgi:hypothetical protein